MSEASEKVETVENPAPEARGGRIAMLVVALALGFAIVPRLVDGFSKPSGTEDAPDFTVRVVANAESGEQKTLTLSALRGKPVVLDFWATWCGPCQAESPIVNGIAQRFKDRGVAVVGVNTSDEPGLAERFAAKKGLTFPIVFDEGNKVARAYDVDNLPTLVVISKTGKIVAVRHGVTSDSELDRLVRGVL